MAPSLGAAHDRASPIVTLFAACIFISAFLLFQVQPMVGKRILPWFGGVPGVWTLCLAFYQVTLFLGYGYGHLLERHVATRWHPIVHTLIFGAAIASLPVLPGIEWRPGDSGAPTGRILAMLAANVGLPFLFLAASGPLIQAWFVRAAPGRSPYVLYAVSNAGSFLALLSYPFLIEPTVSLTSGSRLWSVALAAVGVGVIACAWLARRPQVVAVSSEISAELSDAARPESLGATRPFLWIALSACAVVLLMGVTNELCLDVASIPFLWIAPLALYLVTFIVCFSSETPPSRGWLVALAASSLFALAAVGWSSLASTATGAGDITVQITVLSLLLLFHCLVLHRELFVLRPAPERLTTYYLCISFGGAAGGLLVGIGAPRWFADYHELPLGLIACWVLVSLCWLHGSEWASAVMRRGVGVATVCLGLVAGIASIQPSTLRVGSVVHQVRNFFGVLRVLEIEPDNPQAHRRALKSGTTVHGLQFAAGPRRRAPTLYYADSTGVGFALREAMASGPLRVGVVGLGVGTLATYGRAGDVFRFYEIDPGVIRIALEPTYFAYLTESAARVEVVAGDGRLSLEREYSTGSREDTEPLDLLVLDAFSSDAIPVHLLTAEAFTVYSRALRPTGMLAVHVSNVNLELAPLVMRLGAELGMRALSVENRPTQHAKQVRATWVLLTRDERSLAAIEAAVTAWREALPPGRRNPWLATPMPAAIAAAPRFTDDYSDVFSLLKSRGR